MSHERRIIMQSQACWACDMNQLWAEIRTHHKVDMSEVGNLTNRGSDGRSHPERPRGKDPHYDIIVSKAQQDRRGFARRRH